MTTACGSSAFSSSSRARSASLVRAIRIRRGPAARGIHAHVERPHALVAEAAGRVVDLHRRDAEIREHDVHAAKTLGGEHLQQSREGAATRRERVGGEAGGADLRFGPLQLHRIQIESDQPAAGLDAIEDRLRVAAATKRAIDGEAARLRLRATQHLLDHDRKVHTRRRLARRQDLADVVGVPLGIEFLVLLVEGAWMLAGVPRTPHVRRRLSSASPRLTASGACRA